MTTDIETARRRAAKIGAASASFQDCHSLFCSHRKDKDALLGAMRIVVVLMALSFAASLAPELSTVLVLANVGLAVVYFPSACRYLPGPKKTRQEGIVGMAFRVNMLLIPLVFGAIAFAFLGGFLFSLTAGFLSHDPFKFVQPGAAFGISIFLFFYFMWARHLCEHVWSDAP